MTKNKPIIINDVDVSGCRDHCMNCDTVTNCNYKQFKRKEQECEELSKKAVDLMKALSIANTNLQQKEKECERITAQYNEVVKQNKDLQTENRQCRLAIVDLIKLFMGGENENNKDLIKRILKQS